MNSTLEKILMAPVKLVSLTTPVWATVGGIYGGIAAAGALGTMAVGLPVIGAVAGFIVGRAYFVSAYGGILGNDRTFGEALADTFTAPVKWAKYKIKDSFNKKASPNTAAAGPAPQADTTAPAAPKQAETHAP